MAQRDNALNFKTSKAALRDSSDMRTIANVTLVFLPATAAAVCFFSTFPLSRSLLQILYKSLIFRFAVTQTFFSTAFFNFQKENRVVSPWIWLYCVVSAGLTAIVFLGWYWFTQRTHIKLNKKSLRKSL